MAGLFRSLSGFVVDSVYFILVLLLFYYTFIFAQYTRVQDLKRNDCANNK